MLFKKFIANIFVKFCDENKIHVKILRTFSTKIIIFKYYIKYAYIKILDALIIKIQRTRVWIRGDPTVCSPY